MAVHLVLLAGGRGTRFWPLSRRRRPKQLLPLLDARTLLRRTWERVAPLGRPERAWVVTAGDLARACRRELPELPAARVIGEPEGRNTAPALALAGALALAEDPRAVLAVFPSDHHVADEPAFRRLVRRALRCAREEGALVTLGVTPDRAETGYGYIETEGRAAGGEPLPVRRFVEKPGAARARRFLADGRHLWNSGTFFFTARALAEAFLTHAPDLWEAVAPAAAAFPGPRFARRLREAYRALPAASFDVAIMEKAARVRVLPADVGWSDIGHWISLGALLPERAGNRAHGELVAVDAADNVVVDTEGLTALVGVRDLVVVRAGGALLVCHRRRAQALRDLVAALAAAGREDYL
ncbi:MAG: mannose-1-phosphate guanylyltransferase [Candidatus Krumholzibacteriota bacterium]|nr:mannose-1-phosphate guanylyltransferase [Candidatus Krumholzibacteriota bacterium]